MCSNSSKEIFDHIAALAKVPLEKWNGEEEQRFSAVLEYVKELGELDLDSVPETARVTDEENVLREDMVEQSLTQEEALKNAPEVHNGYFVAESVMERNNSHPS